MTTRQRTALSITVVIALALTTLSGLTATTVQATPAQDRAFVNQINDARTSRGLPAYSSNAELAAVAQSWAEHMAARKHLYHNPNLATQVKNYRWVGENVGYGPNPTVLHKAFMDSPGHRANILDKQFTQVGVGTHTRDGRLWVATVFRQPTASSTVASTETKKAKKAAKKAKKVKKRKTARKHYRATLQTCRTAHDKHSTERKLCRAKAKLVRDKKLCRTRTKSKRASCVKQARKTYRAAKKRVL